MESQALPREVMRSLAEQGINEFHVAARRAPVEADMPNPASASARLFGGPPVVHFHKSVDTRRRVWAPTTREHPWDDLAF